MVAVVAAGMGVIAGGAAVAAVVVGMRAAEVRLHREGRAATVVAVAARHMGDRQVAVAVAVATGPSRRVAAGTEAVQAAAVTVPHRHAVAAVAGGTVATRTLSPAQAEEAVGGQGTSRLLPRRVVQREVAPASGRWQMTGVSGKASLALEVEVWRTRHGVMTPSFRKLIIPAEYILCSGSFAS